MDTRVQRQVLHIDTSSRKTPPPSYSLIVPIYNEKLILPEYSNGSRP